MSLDLLFFTRLDDETYTSVVEKNTGQTSTDSITGLKHWGLS